jgi:glutathione peroxidase
MQSLSATLIGSILLAGCSGGPPTPSAGKPWAAAAARGEPVIYSFTMDDIEGKPKPLADYRGKVLLIVNVASKCGYTGQYEGLQELFETYASRGFEIVGVPANNFWSQEPGTNEEIQTFCSTNYGVTFTMLAKVSVAGDDMCPLYQYLTSDAIPAEDKGGVAWNFEKFLIGRDGTVLARFRSGVKPADIAPAIENALAAQQP